MRRLSRLLSCISNWLGLGLVLTVICLPRTAAADPARDAKETSPLRWSLSSISEVVSNLGGGIASGTWGIIWPV
jgi:hypothetical protein